MSPKGLETFAQKYRSTFTDDPAILSKSHIYQEDNQGNLPSGIENYMPLFFDNSATFFDYLRRQLRSFSTLMSSRKHSVFKS
ncbi:hypothetical protein [Ignatzschineria indica]|uniref:hypothetical protein n=1 Tax=Ignatzschineria indica TaxID=472583 RepID=UPI003631163B